MDIPVFVKVFLLLAMLGFIHCDVSATGDTTSGETLMTPAENASLSFFLQSPKKLILFMDREGKYDFNFSIPCEQNENLIIEFSSKHSTVFEVTGDYSLKLKCLPDYNTTGYSEDSRPSISNQRLFINGSFPVAMKGNRLGLVGLIVTVRSTTASSRVATRWNSSDSSYAEHVLPVVVLRYIRAIDKAFLSVIPVFIVIVLIGFGCKLELEVVKECVKKPLAPGIGFVCQYVIMPLIGFTVAKLVPTGDKGVSLGIFLCGICPGGGISNIYTYLLDGDVSLSITMTFVSTVAAIGMMPLWIYTLGRVFTNDQTELAIPYLDILQITAMVAGALLIGVFLKLKCPKIAKAYNKILKPITIICVVFVISVGIYSNIYLFRMFQPIHFAAGCLLPYLGYLLGGVISAVFRIPWVRVKTIAIETGLQNVGVAYILLMKSFKPPYGDIAALAPAASGLMTPLPLLVITIVYLIYKRCTRKYNPVEQKSDVYNKNHETGNSLTDRESITLEKLSSV